MAEDLERIARNANPRKNEYLSDRRVEKLREALNQPLPSRRRLGLKVLLASSLLNAGYSEQAVTAYREVKTTLKQKMPKQMEKRGLWIRKQIALSFLRIGEQENCLENHTIDSCLFPIRDGGVHKIKRGSRKAKEVLLKILEDYPHDLDAKWLLNIASMTLGEYPDGIPEQWRVPPETFEADYQIERFVDVAGRHELDVNALAGGVVVADFNRDGRFDIMVSSMGLRDQLRLFRGTKEGTFQEVTKAAGLMGLVGGLNLIHADYNNDGYPDVLVLRGGWFGSQGRHPNSLLRNDGDGTFTDVTRSAGLYSRYPTQTATWFDYDLDGHLDLFIGNETWKREYPCELYHNNGDGTFDEVAREAGVRVIGLVKGVVSADINNDRYPELYISRMTEPNLLFENRGSKPKESSDGWRRFTDITERAGVAEPDHSFPAWFWDYNNDGWQDLFVAGYRMDGVGDVLADYLGREHDAELPRLYRNNGDGTFEDVTKEAHLDRIVYAMGANYGDLDNDGFQDFYVGTGDPDLSMLMPNRMFRNAEGEVFQDVTSSGGFGHLQKGHGIAFVDVDQDGDQDIYEVMGGAYTGDVYRNAFYENPGGDNHWLKLKLVGNETNRGAIGVRVKVVTAGPDGTREIHRTVRTGGSFGSDSLIQEIGLGDAGSIERVRVHWPVSDQERTYLGLELDRAYRIIEGKAKAEELALQSVRLGHERDVAR